jgi:hypothetical protein
MGLLDGCVKEVTRMLENGNVLRAQPVVAEMSRPTIRIEQISPQCMFTNANVHIVAFEHGAELCASSAVEGQIAIDNLRYTAARVSAIASLEKGDRLFQTLQETEDNSVMMDYTYMAIDEFRAAVRSANELDVETEATALSRLGRCVTTILKRQARGKDYFHQAVQHSARF